MKKKIVGILIVSTLVMISALSSVTTATKVDFTSESSEKRFEYVNSDECELVVTAGPITSLFDIYEIDLIDGDPEQIQEIEQLLNTTYSPDNIGMTTLKCSNLSFSINYTKKVPSFIPIITGFSYFTTLIDSERPILSYFMNSINGKTHTLTVNGFNGDFTAIRAPFFKNLPGQFAFWGEYEEVTIIR